MNPCFQGSRVSKNLSEPALSDGFTSQFHPSGITSGVARGAEADRLIDGGARLGRKIDEVVGLIDGSGVESPGGGMESPGGVESPGGTDGPGAIDSPGDGMEIGVSGEPPMVGTGISIGA